VNYSSNDQRFSIILPVHISDAVGYKSNFTESPKKIAGSTQKEVEDELEKILRQFSSMVTKEEKVILFLIKPELLLHEGRHCTHHESTSSKIDPYSVTFHHELVLSLRFYVVTKKLFNQREVYFSHDYNENKRQPMIGSGSYNGWQAEKSDIEKYDGFVEIPWTQEREDFFGSAQLGFVNLINKLIDFRNVAKTDSAKMLAFIDSGGNFGLALPPGKEEKS
jgi:hypothetical protein